MPFVIDNTSSTEWTDPDLVSRPVVAVGAVTTGVTRRQETGPHRHRKGQFLLLLRGVLTCEVDDGFWIVPPHSAIWVPGGVRHQMTIAGAIEGYIVFIEPAAAAHLPSTPCTVTATPLLRELAIRAAGFPMLYPEGGMESHLVTLLLDEIAGAPTGALHVPMPTDPRLRRMLEMMLDNPAERGTLHTWARRIGVGERTLARLLTKNTGMSFGRWRQQIQIMLAVRWLGSGASVQQVADDLGYESAGSFVTMFRKALGAPPRRYIVEQSR